MQAPIDGMDDDQSQIDPAQFQNLFDQMQNNQDFLQKMQGILALQNYQITTESDENSLYLLQRPSSLNRFSNINEDNQVNLIAHSNGRAESAQNQQNTEFFDYTPNRTFTSQVSYQIDSNNKNLFQEQFQSNDQSHLQQQFQMYQQHQQQQQQQQQYQQIKQPPQALEQIDMNMITPEYLQMFNQFYQMFSQLQASQQMDLSSDPSLLQTMMVSFFTQMMQNQQNLGQQNYYGYPEGPSSPRQRDYNNLPLAAIPESKESILEENSGWGTVKTNKFGAIMSANSGFQKENGCSCCVQCLDYKKKGILNQCSNFNLGNQMFFHNSQLNQETFIQKSDVSSNATSQILNNPFGLGSVSPSPNHNMPYDLQSQYNSASNQVSQNLNQMFQIQFQGTFSNQEVPNNNNNSVYQSRQDSYQSNQDDLVQNIEQQFHQQHQIHSPKQMSGEYQMVHDPYYISNIRQDASQPEILSPKQIQQNKLIEYMIDNNDFSNYKQRRQVIKGERMSRTLSRSGSKNSVMYWQHNHKPSIQNSNYQFNQSQIQLNLQPNQYHNDEHQQQQYFSDAKLQNKNLQNDDYNQQHQYQQVDYNRDTLQYFSPQITNKQQIFGYKNRFEDLGSDNQEVTSPDTQRESDRNQSKGQNIKRKRTQEKIKEIRKLNELQRGKDLLKKSQTRKNIHKQPSSKTIFEIKDLKKSKSKNANHLRKQSLNVASNKENNKLTQSNYQNQYEMSQQQIMLSQNQDLLLTSTDENPYQHNKKESNTFKSLNSVVNSRINHSKQTLRLESGENLSPQITNLKLLTSSGPGQNQVVTSFDNNNHMYLKKKSAGLDLNNILLQEENKKPGQEIHIIKKPVQTEELKKIQERLNKYYQDKRREENEQKMFIQQQNNQKNTNSNQCNDMEAMSMTKTLSSFKSLMMKTMSQMSIQQDNNIQQQYIQGKDQRSKQLQQYKTNSNNNNNNNNCNQSVNVSSIQDDYSVGGDYSENLTKIISPKNLYNGQLGNIKQRNGQSNDQPNFEYVISEKQIENETNHNHQKSQCLPNSLFFKKSNGNQQLSGEDTLSLKYNSRQPSLCYCGKSSCICDQNSKKDLLSHFQNFLQEMDKHPPFNNQGLPINRESLYQSPIANLGHSNSTHDFFMSNLQFLGIGRSSSQNSILSRPKGVHSNRQSSITAKCNQIINQPKIKRFSSGALINLPLKKLNHNNQHCQSTQLLQNTKKISLGNEQEDIGLKKLKDQKKELDNSPLKSMPSADQLEKLDTNKEEEIRLLTIENDIMHKAFIQKSHRLNLQDSQRNELLQRIQKYKQEQQSATTRHNLGKSLQEENYYSNGAVGSTQNTSQATGLGNSHNNSGGNSITEKHVRGQSDGATSLEERRKIEKYRKKAEKILQAQSERENQIQQDAEKLQFY
ncbi:UNKNOWN [Stylonychia lemnae]|uniref:Uncharacterized protein n=1 Tax=Stylonychia lemnae TaxID=5949 RepID=A0A078AZE5_STYLE|nr:UNKNOWN [Stylonychia lemnae]|eukprot:CDW87481.1 UNKNOWN [Stylonychia lemnae]